MNKREETEKGNMDKEKKEEEYKEITNIVGMITLK